MIQNENKNQKTLICTLRCEIEIQGHPSMQAQKLQFSDPPSEIEIQTQNFNFLRPSWRYLPWDNSVEFHALPVLCYLFFINLAILLKIAHGGVHFLAKLRA